MIVLIAQYFGKPGTGAEVESALRRMATLVREEEPGCLTYHASRPADAPDDWLLYEVYADQEAFEAHRRTPHFLDIIEGEIIPKLERRERRVYELVIS